jgi:hypothetical protein
LLRILPNHGDVDSGISGPQEELAGTPKLAELPEHQLDRIGDTLVRIHFDFVEVVPAVTRR